MSCVAAAAQCCRSSCRGIREVGERSRSGRQAWELLDSRSLLDCVTWQAEMKSKSNESLPCSRTALDERCPFAVEIGVVSLSARAWRRVLPGGALYVRLGNWAKWGFSPATT